jgi:5-methylcytosine-specific restriction endonuclease McrA
MACKRLPDDYCQHCGTLITRERCGKDSRKYCNKPCYFAAIAAGKQQFKGRMRDDWTAFVDWAYEWDRKCKIARRLPATRLCDVCQKPTASTIHRFCGRACMKSWRGKKQCGKCGSIMQSASWCATVCGQCRKDAVRKSRKANKNNFRRRARHYDVEYTPIKRLEVYERDGWKCQLCGKMCKRKWMINKKTGTPHPLCPTIDHIVPMSKGGGHVMHNVQLACWHCNTRKGSRAKGQLFFPLADSAAPTPCQ